MTEVKKYHYSVYLPNKYSKSIEVTNSTHLNGITYVTTTDKNNPIVKFNTKENGLIENPISIDGFSKSKIKYIGFIKDRLAIVPKYSWNIQVLNDNCKGYKSIIFQNCSSDNLKYNIIEGILKKYPNSCKCSDCYHLVGFIQLHNFNIFVQLSCLHRPDQKFLYIIRGNINLSLLELNNDIEVTNEYNLYRLCLDQGLSEKCAITSMLTGLYYDGNKVYIISTHGKEGCLWEMTYYANISYLGPPLFVAKLRRQPKGICSIGTNLIVLCNNIQNQKMYYYVITRSETQKKN